MRIEALERIMQGSDVYEKGDIRKIDDSTGAYFCACGWAKDLDGNIKTGERNINNAVITPDNVVHKTIAGDANG